MLGIGWRYMAVDYRPASSFIYDAAQQGLLLGVTTAVPHCGEVVVAKQFLNCGQVDRQIIIGMSLPGLTLFLVLLATCASAALAQEAEALPELDTYLKLDANVRFRVQASNTREGGDPTQLTIGPDLELYLKPLIRLKKVTAFDLDNAKARPLVFTAGYRYLATPGSPSTNRMELTTTAHFPLRLDFLLTDRNRADLDWTDGTFMWRYRNRLQFEKSLNVSSYHPIPYISAEVYYQEQYQKWGTTELYAGSLFPIKKRYEFDLYYEHQNNTGKKPNSQLEGIGLKLNMFFSLRP